MGFYLNSIKPATLYAADMQDPYFVDKTEMLDELITCVEQGKRYICITRPRRFGKTMMANMIGAYFGKNDMGTMFDSLKIANSAKDREHRNQHNVIYIDFSDSGDGCDNYKDYITTIKEILQDDLHNAYPNVNYRAKGSVSENMGRIHEAERTKFIFVFDEWDYIFHQNYVTNDEKRQFIMFLHNLLKSQPYVELAYMTGILPIAQYSSGSGINMFREYTMGTQHLYNAYFGFTETEVDMLYGRYLKATPTPLVSRHGLKEWYDGYDVTLEEKTMYTDDNGEEKVSVEYVNERMYNPRSVVFALTNNKMSDYWTSSGPYDEIFYYVKNNVAGVRDDIAKLIAGETVKANVSEYSATSQKICTRDEILSAMVVYGFLTVDNDKLRIPNKELMNKFVDMVKKENALGYVYNLAKVSERMLAATKAGDTETMVEIMQKAHDTETGMLGYNNEAELSAIVKLVYLSARDDYDMVREDKAGVGYVDYILKPKKDMTDDCIIVELKVDATAEAAIEQIKSRNYAQTFIGKVGEKPIYLGRILAVGITYFKDDMSKKHQCKVEVLREKL